MKLLKVLLSITVFGCMFFAALEVSAKVLGNLSVIQYLGFASVALVMASMLFTMAKEG